LADSPKEFDRALLTQLNLRPSVSCKMTALEWKQPGK